MALTKTTEEDKIEVVGPYKAVQVRTATVIKEDGNEISRSFHRKVLHPGTLDSSNNLVDTDVSAESAEVKGITSSVWTQAVKDAWKAKLIADKGQDMALTQTPEEGLKVSNAPSDGQFLQYKDSTDKLTWAAAGAGSMSNIVEDTTPQLGGNLDVQDKVITTDTGTNTNITIKPKGTGELVVGNGSSAGLISVNGDYNLKIKSNGVGSAGSYVQCGGGSNGNVTLGSEGTGYTLTSGDFRVLGNNLKLGSAAAANITTVAGKTTHLKLNTNEGTNSGEIEIEDGVNNDIKITPNGTGDVVIDGLKYPQADGSSGQYLKTDGSGQLSWGTVTSQDTLSNRNVLINGDMRISQRGTSQSLSGSQVGYFKAPDRWRFYNHHSHGDWAVSQTSGDGPNAFGHTYKIACSTADTSIGSTADVHLEQRVEANNIQPLGFGTNVGENLQLSFWVKSKLTGTYTVELYSYADNHAISNTYTVSSAETWEHKTVTFTAPDSGDAQIRGTGGGLMVIWYLAAGSTLTSGSFSNNAWSAGEQTQANRVHSSQVNLASSTNNYIQFTGMQLECASAATAYEHRLFSRELADCQRYYEKSYPYSIVPGAAGDNGRRLRRVCASATNQTVFTNEQFQVRKRTTPTITTYSNDGTSGKVLLTNYGSTSIHANSSVYGACDYGFEVSGSDTANGIGLFWTAESEL